MNKCYNHVRLTFDLSDNIELDFMRPANEDEEYGVQLSFSNYGKEAIESDLSPIPSPMRKFSQDSIRTL